MLSTAEAAARLNVSEQTIRRLCEDGKFEGAFKVGRQWRIPADAIADYIARQQQAAQR